MKISGFFYGSRLLHKDAVILQPNYFNERMYSAMASASSTEN